MFSSNEGTARFTTFVVAFNTFSIRTRVRRSRGVDTTWYRLGLELELYKPSIRETSEKAKKQKISRKMSQQNCIPVPIYPQQPICPQHTLHPLKTQLLPGKRTPSPSTPTIVSSSHLAHTSSTNLSFSLNPTTPSDSTPSTSASTIVSSSTERDGADASDSQNDLNDSLYQSEPSYLHWKSNNPFFSIVINAVPSPQL
ncbi:protoporphyrinogen oxidase [Moniliophthora roreri]|nr:protoporphyrinogen oxidase [Moniliophthora roreri]